MLEQREELKEAQGYYLAGIVKIHHVYLHVLMML
jgi:hypothetical protein